MLSVELFKQSARMRHMTVKKQRYGEMGSNKQDRLR